MVAHGYGIAAKGSPNLIFSSVLWGYLVRLVPTVDGVLGYSLATLSVLVAIGAVLVWGLCRAGIGYAFSAVTMVLILTRPVLFPQFTINAGLLMVAAVVCWQVAARVGDARAFVGGCLLAFFSYLVRSQEFVLVFLVALPLMPWRLFLLHRRTIISLMLLASAIAVAAVIDHRAYQGDDWKAFNDLNPARAPFTDYGAAELLKHRPDILKRHGYSSNDIELVRLWFFDDPRIADPNALKEMVHELGPLYTQGNALANAWIGVTTLWNPVLLVFVLVALLLLFLCPSWRVIVSWGLCIAAVFMLGLLGRPGVLRVYVPLVSLLLIAPVMLGSLSGWRWRLGFAAILLAAITNASTTFSESRKDRIADEAVRREIAGFPTDPVVVWGAVFPFREIYPVLGAPTSAMSYRLYGLGVFTLAPFSVPYAEKKVGGDMVDLLVEKNGLPIIANEQRFDNLKRYCREHFGGALVELSRKSYGPVEVSRRRCEDVL